MQFFLGKVNGCIYFVEIFERQYDSGLKNEEGSDNKFCEEDIDGLCRWRIIFVSLW